jgi:hypothetical protein
MTAHRPKPTITPEIVERFAAYHGRGFPSWGVFAPVFDDARYGDAELTRIDAQPLTDEERVMVTTLRALTFSQRKRLGEKAAALAAQRRQVAA